MPCANCKYFNNDEDASEAAKKTGLPWPQWRLAGRGNCVLNPVWVSVRAGHWCGQHKIDGGYGHFGKAEWHEMIHTADQRDETESLRKRAIAAEKSAKALRSKLREKKA